MATLAGMEKKEDTHRSRLAPFRPTDRRLLKALDYIARRERRSRNAIINMALEKYAREEGVWPWPPPGLTEDGEAGGEGD